ncbi:CaiB/BaiF CoA transferase family protein [Piscinibacter sakaiensis]|uniref:CaiB/BaiF CoA transferase family protein n=1 Tax=Piscinibacter sakaiensis TaxID=1547922 RepID=UPI003AAAAF48
MKPNEKTNTGPLAGIRILDLTSVAMGPYMMQTIGDLGAEVIKVEPPQGDITRHLAPGRSAGMSPLFLQLNRSKRSVVLDLKDSAGRDALLQLARGADALVCNVRPAAMARLGLDYAAVAAVSKKIVYCSLVGFGQAGRYARRAALDDLIQGGSGLAALAARQDGTPHYAPGWIADQSVGLVGTYALLAALLHRERTGEGQAVEVPMFETMAQYMLTPHLYGKTFRPPIGGTGYPRIFARRPFKTQDGYICATAYTPAHWYRFFELIGRAELKKDPRFCDQAGISAHVAELNDIFAESVRTRSTTEWLRLLEDADIPVLPMHTPDSLIDDPHLAEVGFFEDVEHPSEGPIRTMSVPTKWSHSKPVPARMPPTLGQHSLDILREAGLSQAQIDDLLARGVTRDGAS